MRFIFPHATPKTDVCRVTQLDPPTVGLVIKGQPLIAGHLFHNFPQKFSKTHAQLPGIYLFLILIIYFIFY